MSDVDEIRQRMALIRHEMHHDVSSVVSEVEDVLDWRWILRRHPYVSMGVGLVVGYLVVPRRKSQGSQVRQALADVAPQLSTLAQNAESRTAAAVDKPRKSLGRQLFGWGVGMLWPLVGQSVQAYAAMWLEDQLKQHLRPPGSSNDFAPPPSPSSGAQGGVYAGDPAKRPVRRG